MKGLLLTALLALLTASQGALAQATCPGGACAFDRKTSQRLVADNSVAGIGKRMTRYLDLCTAAGYSTSTQILTLNCQTGATTIGTDGAATATQSTLSVPVGGLSTTDVAALVTAGAGRQQAFVVRALIGDFYAETCPAPITRTVTAQVTTTVNTIQYAAGTAYSITANIGGVTYAPLFVIGDQLRALSPTISGNRFVSDAQHISFTLRTPSGVPGETLQLGRDSGLNPLLAFASSGSATFNVCSLAASAGGGGAAGELSSLAALPAPADYDPGDIVNFGGVLYELVTVNDQGNVLRGTSALETVYTGVSTIAGQAARGSWTTPGYEGEFQWIADEATANSGAYRLFRARLPKSVLANPPPVNIFIVFTGQRGEVAESVLARQAARDTANTWAYESTPLSDIATTTPAGDTFRVEFFVAVGGARGPALTVHAATHRFEQFIERKADLNAANGICLRGSGDQPGQYCTPTGAGNAVGWVNLPPPPADTVPASSAKAGNAGERRDWRTRIDAAPGALDGWAENTPDLAHERRYYVIEQVDPHGISLVWDVAEGCFEAADIPIVGTYTAVLTYCTIGGTGTGTDRGKFELATTAPNAVTLSTLIDGCTIRSLQVTVGSELTLSAVIKDPALGGAFGLISNTALSTDPAWAAGTDTETGTLNFECTDGSFAWPDPGTRTLELMTREQMRSALGVTGSTPTPTTAAAWAQTGNTALVPDDKLPASAKRAAPTLSGLGGLTAAEVDTAANARIAALVRAAALQANATSFDVGKFCEGGILTAAQYNALPSRSSSKLYCRVP